MIFKERQLESTLEYTVEDVFGTITISSSDKLDAPTLDDIVLGIMKAGNTEGTIGETASFTWKKAPTWLPEEKLEPGDTV